MHSEHYVHPEFGCLAPTPRFRRELRVGLLSTLFGISIGVVAVTALSTGSRDPDSLSASGARTGDVVASPPGAMQMPPDGGPDKRVEAAE